MGSKEMERPSLMERLFSPKSVAFVGASNDPTKWGHIILSNLLRGGYGGDVYPINPREREILGLKVYPSIKDCPGPVDLSVLVVPPKATIDVLRQCLEKGIRAALVITAGFEEVGREGVELQREMQALARNGGMAIVGPNCNGLMCPKSGFYCTMPPIYPEPGPFSIVSQSGNVASTLTRSLTSRGFGLDHYISSGNEAVLHMEDYLEYLNEETTTRVILCYIEGFRDGRRFFEVARRVAMKKPIVVLKAGQTPEGARAARSHTAAVAGSDVLFDGMCTQVGLLRAGNVDELVEWGGVFLGQPLPKGNRVGIVTGGGGWGVLAADMAARMGLEVPALSEETLKRLDEHLPPWWTRGNPVDMVAGLKGGVMKVLDVLLASDDVDGSIVLGLTGGILEVASRMRSKWASSDIWTAAVDAMSDSLRGLQELKHRYGKPVVVAQNIPVGFGDAALRLAALMKETQNFLYISPHQAAGAYWALARYGEHLRAKGVKRVGI